MFEMGTLKLVSFYVTSSRPTVRHITACALQVNRVHKVLRVLAHDIGDSVCVWKSLLRMDSPGIKYNTSTFRVH